MAFACIRTAVESHTSSCASDGAPKDRDEDYLNHVPFPKDPVFPGPENTMNAPINRTMTGTTSRTGRPPLPASIETMKDHRLTTAATILTAALLGSVPASGVPVAKPDQAEA